MRDNSQDKQEELLITASRIASFWVMLEAGRKLDGEVTFDDTQLVLSYMGDGASDTLTVRDFRNLVDALTIQDEE